MSESEEGYTIPYAPLPIVVSGNLSIPPARASSPMRPSMRDETAPPKTTPKQTTIRENVKVKVFNEENPNGNMFNNKHTTEEHRPITNGNMKKRTRKLQVPRPNIPTQPSTNVNNAPKASASKSNAAPQSNSDYYNHLLTQMYKEIENIEKSNNIPGPDKITLKEKTIAHYGALGELYGLKQSGRGRKTRRSNRKSKRKTKRSHARRT